MPVIEAIGRHASKPLDVHLMIEAPDRYIGHFAKLNAAVLTVHAEACTHLHRTVGAIREAGMKAGVALNPHTPLSAIEEVLGDVDLVCLMSVNPGFGGQKFIANTTSKVARLAALRSEAGAQFLIEVDGGVGRGNAPNGFELGRRPVAAAAYSKPQTPSLRSRPQGRRSINRAEQDWPIRPHDGARRALECFGPAGQGQGESVGLPNQPAVR